jgi:hypothetical protein
MVYIEVRGEGGIKVSISNTTDRITLFETIEERGSLTIKTGGGNNEYGGGYVSEGLILLLENQ